MVHTFWYVSVATLREGGGECRVAGAAPDVVGQ